MNAIVSPYHLTTRELPALAAVLLASRVYTLLPTPEETDRASVRRAMTQHPAYLRLLESWRWATPLFRERVIESLCAGDDPAQSVADALDVLTKRAAYQEIAGFVDVTPFAQRGRMLDVCSTDMLKGGPDPGVSIPLAGALDWFAAEHGLMVARAGVAARAAVVGGNAMSASLALRAEAALGESLVSFMVPVVSSASAIEILEIRHELEAELDELRGAIDDAVATAGPAATKRVRAAAKAFAAAFASEIADMIGHDDTMGKRLMATECSVVLRRLPGDAAFVSSIAAIRQAKSRGMNVARVKATAQAAVKVCEPPSSVVGMVVTAMGGVGRM